jgi:hypothetical protein
VNLNTSRFVIPITTSPKYKWSPYITGLRSLRCLLFLGCCAVILGYAPAVWTQTINVASPTGLGTKAEPLASTGGSKMQLKFTVSDAKAFSKVRIIAYTGKAARDADYEVNGTGEQKLTLNLLSGTNEISLIGFSGARLGAAAKPQATIFITCNDDECGTARDLIAKETQPSPGGGGQPKTDGNLVIQSPTGDVAEGPVETLIAVKGGLKKVAIVVSDSEGNRVDYKASVDVKNYDNVALAFTTLKVVKGPNLIRVYDPAKLGDKANEAQLVVNCTGEDKCGKLGVAAVEGPKPPMQKGSIHINSPTSGAIYNETKTAALGVKVDRKDDPKDDITRIAVRVLNQGQPIIQPDSPRVVQPAEAQAAKKAADIGLLLNIAKGTNEVTVFDPKNPDTELASVLIKCELGCPEVAEASASVPGLITIDNPAANRSFQSSFRDAYLTVAKSSQIKKIKYFVLHGGKTVVNADEVAEVEVKYDGENPGKVVVPIKFVEGENTITFIDANDPNDRSHQATLKISCVGLNCATDFQLATIPTNSMNTRAVVGMEQVGASSASSETKPFLDFFFTGPLRFDNLKEKAWVPMPVLNPNGTPQLNTDGTQKTVLVKTENVVRGPDGKPIRVPRFGTWGQVRFSTTPQQTASASVFPSNFVNQITDPSKVIDLVQSFDFLAGVEYRAFSANGWNWTLIPGARQRTRFFFTFGAGAITPLNAARVNAQVFKIPPAAGGGTPAGSQRTEFERRFGIPPADKTYVGFVPLERDRFFRQYYVGIRLKSHYCEDDDCKRFKNSFPSIIDVGFGQNEAVTGGTFKQNGKRAWVVRLDAFYNLPFKPANFLYLYASTVMKVGQGGPRIDNPLFLDTAPGEVQITDTSVFIPPADLQPARLNRDYYKIGVGVNLTDLFNRNKTPPQ